MLNKISWTSFGIILIFILVVYYLYVLIMYFRKDILAMSALNKKTFRANGQDTESVRPISHKEKSSGKTPNSGDNSFTMVHELVEDLKNIFEVAYSSKMIREELIQAIRSRLKSFPAIRETDLVTDINEHLVMEVKDKCGEELSEEDLKLIWS